MHASERRVGSSFTPYNTAWCCSSKTWKQLSRPLAAHRWLIVKWITSVYPWSGFSVNVANDPELAICEGCRFLDISWPEFDYTFINSRVNFKSYYLERLLHPDQKNVTDCTADAKEKCTQYCIGRRITEPIHAPNHSAETVHMFGIVTVDMQILVAPS